MNYSRNHQYRCVVNRSSAASWLTAWSVVGAALIGLGGASQLAAAAPIALNGSLQLPKPLDRVVADPIRNKAYGFTEDGDVVFIDGATRTIEKTIPTGRKFTDIDVSPNGSFVTLLDNVTREYWNQPPATYLLKFDLASQSLLTTQLVSSPLFHMALGKPDRVAGVEVNQWVSVFHVNSATGAQLSSSGGGYFGSGSTDRHNVTLVATPDGTRMFRTDIGISSIDLLAFDISADVMAPLAGRGNVGSYATEPVFINSTGTSLYVGDIRIDPYSPASLLGLFPETIYAATGNDAFAFGRNSYYDPASGQNLGAMPVQSTFMSIGAHDQKLFALSDNRTTLHFMTVVPEPNAMLIALLPALLSLSRVRASRTFVRDAA